MKSKYLVACICCFSISFCSFAVTQNTHSNVFTEKDIEHFSLLEKNNNKAFESTAKQLYDNLTKKAQDYSDTHIDENLALKKQIQDKTAKVLKQESKTLDNLNPTKSDRSNIDTLIFASFSLPKNTLEQMYKATAGNERVSIVFNGLPKGTKTINEAIFKIQQIAIDLNLEYPPNAVINPVWFKQYKVDKVPTIIALQDKTHIRSGDPKTNTAIKEPEVISKVYGLYDPTWLYQRMKEGAIGDLGIKGPVFNIEERDLIEEMKDRAAKINWQEKKDKALARAWDNIPVESLTKAYEYRKRIVNPTFTVKQDIKLPNGTFIAHKGDKINPLQQRAFPRLLIVFDASDLNEVKFVKHNLNTWTQKAKVNSAQVKLIASKLNREDGWKGYNRLLDYFDDEIFVLTPEVKQSFVLEKHPAIVYAENDRFVVEEFNVE